MGKSNILEICAASYEDCKNAYRGGAQRVELNTALSAGGLTPSISTLKRVKADFPSLSVICMLRPREGHFYYDQNELNTMYSDLDLLMEAGADGIAIGIHTKELNLDYRLLQDFRDRYPKKEWVCHRAFDFLDNPIPALTTLFEIGYNRVLTSGCRPTAEEGIKQLSEFVKSPIEILPASGVRPHNALTILQNSGCNQLHASASSTVLPPINLQNHIELGGFSNIANGAFKKSDLDVVKELRAILDSLID